MEISAHFDRRHARDLDGIRGVFALCIVVLHYGFNSFVARASHGWLPHGAILQLTLGAFFVLSGYVLTGSLKRSRPSFGHFAHKRIYRLAPVYLLTTAITLFVAPADYDWRYLPLEAIAGLPLIGASPVNWPSWSVSWEFYLPIAAYAISPWLPKLSVTGNRIGLTVAMITLGVLDNYVLLDKPIDFPEAVAGMLTGHFLYNARLGDIIAWRPIMTPALLALSLAITIPAGMASWVGVLFAPLACLMVLSGAANDSAILSSRPLQWLGSISYTVYLVHVPLLMIGHALLGTWFEQNAIAKLAGIAVSLGLATALSRFVEIPFMAYAKRTAPAPARASET